MRKHKCFDKYDNLIITKKEQHCIDMLKKLALKWPKTLWLYSASGSLNIIKTNEEGNRASREDGVDQKYVVDIIDISNDGGDW